MAISADELVRAAVAIDLIDAPTAQSLRQTARRQGASLLDLVTTRGRFPAAAMYQAIAEVRGLPYVNADTAEPATELIERLPSPLLRRCGVLPVHDPRGAHDRTNGADASQKPHPGEGDDDGDAGQTDSPHHDVIVLTADPDEHQGVEAVRRLVNRPVPIALADPEALRLAIDRAVGGQASGSAAASVVHAGQPVALLDRILKDAYLRRASDVHFEPQAEYLRIRMRVDGRLSEYLTGLSLDDGHGVISRVKVLSRLDIAEQRAPQDGGFTYAPPGEGHRPIDIRVATAPTRFGERATLRLLGTETEGLTLESLGMPQADFLRFGQAIRRPHGLVLLTGPTGSGKTTTLYAALRELDRDRLNIMTVEDPIEYLIPGISQMHVGGGDKLTFAGAMRSFLRHDPDVMMVGEIRDRETADVALKAAMTGHLVFSTLHTNNACGAVTRLIDIGCEPYLVASTLLVSIAQRLVRQVCPRCQRARPASTEEMRAMNWTQDTEPQVCDPVGCASCLGTGYRGRTGLFESYWVDEPIRRLIAGGADEQQLSEAAAQRTTLRSDGWMKVRAGQTTVDEVLAATVET